MGKDFVLKPWSTVAFIDKCKVCIKVDMMAVYRKRVSRSLGLTLVNVV